MLVVWLLLVWRMGVSMLDYRDNGEISFILQMPVWWGYARVDAAGGGRLRGLSLAAAGVAWPGQPACRFRMAGAEH